MSAESDGWFPLDVWLKVQTAPASRWRSFSFGHAFADQTNGYRFDVLAHGCDHPGGVVQATADRTNGTTMGQPQRGRDSGEGAMVRIVVTVPTGSIDFILENTACR